MTHRATTKPIEVRDNEWGQVFVGQRADLIEQRLVAPGRFPGDPGNNKVSLKYREDKHSVSVRKISRDRFEVWREYPGDDAKREGLARIAEAERLRNIDNHRARAALPAIPRGYATALQAQLAELYPRLEVRDASLGPFGAAWQQRVTFRGSRQALLDAGLVTERMIERRHSYGETTPIGDCYTYHEHAHYVELTLFTESSPRDGRKTAVHDAMRELKRFMLPMRLGRKV